MLHQASLRLLCDVSFLFIATYNLTGCKSNFHSLSYIRAVCKHLCVCVCVCVSSDAGDSMKLQRADNLVKQGGTHRWLMQCVFSHLMLKRGYSNSQSVHEDVCPGFFLVI